MLAFSVSDEKVLQSGIVCLFVELACFFTEEDKKLIFDKIVSMLSNYLRLCVRVEQGYTDNSDLKHEYLSDKMFILQFLSKLAHDKIVSAHDAKTTKRGV